MSVISFPGTPEPQPEPKPVGTPIESFWAPVIHGLIAVCGEKTTREALEEVLEMPAKDVLGWLL